MYATQKSFLYSNASVVVNILCLILDVGHTKVISLRWQNSLRGVRGGVWFTLSSEQPGCDSRFTGLALGLQGLIKGSAPNINININKCCLNRMLLPSLMRWLSTLSNRSGRRWPLFSPACWRCATGKSRCTETCRQRGQTGHPPRTVRRTMISGLSLETATNTRHILNSIHTQWLPLQSSNLKQRKSI